jgi:hypothetical protein
MLGVKTIEELIQDGLETWLRHLLRGPRPEVAAIDSIEAGRAEKSPWWTQVDALLAGRGQTWGEFKEMCEIDREERSKGRYRSIGVLR